MMMMMMKKKKKKKKKKKNRMTYRRKEEKKLWQTNESCDHEEWIKFTFRVSEMWKDTYLKIKLPKIVKWCRMRREMIQLHSIMCRATCALSLSLSLSLSLVLLCSSSHFSLCRLLLASVVPVIKRNSNSNLRIVKDTRHQRFKLNSPLNSQIPIFSLSLSTYKMSESLCSFLQERVGFKVDQEESHHQHNERLVVVGPSSSSSSSPSSSSSSSLPFSLLLPSVSKGISQGEKNAGEEKEKKT